MLLLIVAYIIILAFLTMPYALIVAIPSLKTMRIVATMLVAGSFYCYASSEAAHCNVKTLGLSAHEISRDILFVSLLGILVRTATDYADVKFGLTKSWQKTIHWVAWVLVLPITGGAAQLEQALSPCIK